MTLFGPLHISLLAAIAGIAAGLAILCRRGLIPARTTRLVVGLVLAANEVIWWTFRYSREGVHLGNLPLQLCDMTVWLSVLACFTAVPVIVEFAYFAGIAGAGMALLTPDLISPWPSYPAIAFFVAHGGIVIAVSLLVFGKIVCFRRGAVWRSFGLLLAYAALVGAFNALFGSNYMYLRQKPVNASVLDKLGPWPWYVAGGAILGLGFFWLLWLPVRPQGARKPEPKRSPRFLLCCAIVFVPLAGVWLAGDFLCARTNRGGGLQRDCFTPVRIVSRSGATLRGEFQHSKPGCGVVVLMHGVRVDRSVMLPRARFLHREGFSVLLCDFQAHGESTGAHPTFGYLERLDAAAEVEYARRQYPGEKVGVIGVSMGGAAALLASPPLPVDAYVLESVYPTLDEAIANRLEARLGGWATALTPLLTVQLPVRFGFHASDLRPIERVAAIHVPKLFLAGTRDPGTRTDESERMFRAAAVPKELWEIDGARHEDLYAFAGAEYERRVGSFLKTCLSR